MIALEVHHALKGSVGLVVIVMDTVEVPEEDLVVTLEETREELLLTTGPLLGVLAEGPALVVDLVVLERQPAQIFPKYNVFCFIFCLVF